jgi:hypothetical protein
MTSLPTSVGNVLRMPSENWHVSRWRASPAWPWAISSIEYLSTSTIFITPFLSLYPVIYGTWITSLSAILANVFGTISMGSDSMSRGEPFPHPCCLMCIPL